MSAATSAQPTTVPAVPIDRPGFRTLLADLRVDCIRRREDALAESAATAPDPVAVNRAARLLRRIQEIDAALQRIADGSYGACVHCGTTIPPERLELRPFAAGCVRCDQHAR
jgi:DnaK suppressor protein